MMKRPKVLFFFRSSALILVLFFHGQKEMDSQTEVARNSLHTCTKKAIAHIPHIFQKDRAGWSLFFRRREEAKMGCLNEQNGVAGGEVRIIMVDGIG